MSGVYWGGRLMAFCRTTPWHLTEEAGGSQYRTGPGQPLQGRVVLLESARSNGQYEEMLKIMKQGSSFIGRCVSIPILLCLVLPVTTEARQATYKVQGTVIAVTLTQTPPLIVVKTPLGPKNHMTVGATVTAHTKIIRGNKRVALNTIREGEVVWLTYIKAPTRVQAEVIRLGA